MNGQLRGLYSPKVRDMVRKGLKSPSSEVSGKNYNTGNRKRDYSQREITAEYMARQIDSSQCPVVWKLKHTQQELMK